MRAALAAGIVIGLLPVPSHAEPGKCRDAVSKLALKHSDTRAKTLAKCEEKVVRGKLPPATDCTLDTKTATKIAKAESKLRTGIAKACGGPDRACGNADDDPLAAIGWDIGQCPDLEDAGCTNAIADCDDIGDCLVCVGAAGVGSSIGLLYDDLDLASPPRSTLEKCQVAIGKETTKFLRIKLKALAKCWKAVNKGSIAGPCPVPGDGKATLKIVRAESKKISKICRACGGPDRGCDLTVGPVGGTGGADDLAPGAIGFAAACPDRTVPSSAAACSGAVANLADLVTCVDCAAEFHGDCLDALAVPWGQAYPGACNPAPGATPTPTPTPTPVPSPSPTPTADACAGFADDFAGGSLDPSWSVLNPSLVQFDVSGGSLNLQPTMSGLSNIWFNDAEGPLIYKEITGDFTVTAIAHAEDPNDPGQPPPTQFRLGGILVRDPGSVAGDRNSAHVALGAGVVATPIAVEDKTTTASTSDFLLYGIATADIELRITRTGTTIDLYYRTIGAGTWTLARSHQHPEFPATVHVGIMTYSTPAPPSIRLSIDEITCSAG